MRVVALALLAAALIPVAAGAQHDGEHAQAAQQRLEVPRQLRVVSYYPADAGWTRMWEPWRPNRIAADLRRLRWLNANTVRIVVSPPHFGYPVPERRYLERLGELVAIAAAEGLHVQLTLFDWWEAYDDLAGSRRWASAVLAPYAGDSRIAFVELRNEIDASDPRALAWARALVPWVRTLLPSTPVTLSVGSAHAARDLRTLAEHLGGASQPDFLTAHHFTGGGELAADVFRRLRQAAVPIPLWIGELGYPTSATVTGYRNLPLTPSAQEAAQAHYLRTGFAALRLLGLPAPGLWILDDFAPGAIPESDVSPREPEYTFGLFRSDGSAKPAAATVRRLFAGARELTFNGGFERTMHGEDGSSLPAMWARIGLHALDVARDDAAARTGSAAARLASRDERHAYGQLSVTPIDAAVRPRRCAEAAAWSRGKLAAGRVRLVLGWFDARFRRIARTSARLPVEEAAWKRGVVRSCPPRGAVFARVAVEAIALSGVAWIDDVAFSWR